MNEDGTVDLNEQIGALIYEGMRNIWRNSSGIEYPPYDQGQHAPLFSPLGDSILSLIETNRGLTHPTRANPLVYVIQTPDGCLDRETIRPTPAQAWQAASGNDPKKEVRLKKIGHRCLPVILAQLLPNNRG